VLRISRHQVARRQSFRRRGPKNPIADLQPRFSAAYSIYTCVTRTPFNPRAGPVAPPNPRIAVAAIGAILSAARARDLQSLSGQPSHRQHCSVPRQNPRRVGTGLVLARGDLLGHLIISARCAWRAVIFHRAHRFPRSAARITARIRPERTDFTITRRGSSTLHLARPPAPNSRTVDAPLFQFKLLRLARLAHRSSALQRLSPCRRVIPTAQSPGHRNPPHLVQERHFSRTAPKHILPANRTSTSPDANPAFPRRFSPAPINTPDHPCPLSATAGSPRPANSGSRAPSPSIGAQRLRQLAGNRPLNPKLISLIPTYLPFNHQRPAELPG